MQASVFFDRIVAGEYQKKAGSFSKKTVYEIDYKLKIFLDSFSRGISWLLG